MKVQEKENIEKQPYLIQFSSDTFGKPTKNRHEEPSMSELLSWQSNGFQKRCFKKSDQSSEPAQVYLNMIGRDPWTSQAQQNYINLHSNAMQVNVDVMNRVEYYLQGKKSGKNERLSHQNTGSNKEVPFRKKLNNFVQKINSPNNQILKKGISNKNDKSMLVERDSKAQNTLNKAINSKIKKNNKDQLMNKSQKINEKSQKGLEQKTNQENLNEMSSDQKRKLIKQFKQTTRWIPNSSFTTYFGKPPFENYGRANTNPIDGGLIYGTYLYSHNVHPHRGNNSPKHSQSYTTALLKAKSHENLVPTQPRSKPQYRKEEYTSSKSFNKGQISMSKTGKIEPQINNCGKLPIKVPCFEKMEKFGFKK